MPQYTRNSRWLIGALSGALLLGGAACDDNNFNAVVILASGITVASGDGQIGTAGAALANPIVVHVTDNNGNSPSNSIVAWTIVSGGGSVSAATSLTDNNGDAVRDVDVGSVRWRTGSPRDDQQRELGGNQCDRPGGRHHRHDREDER